MFTKRLKVIKLMGMVMVALMAVSCVDSLNTSPIDDNVVTSNQVFENPENFKKVLAKMYAGLAVTGQQGPAGQPDIQGIAEGLSSYIRQNWVHQVVSTDETRAAWSDTGHPQLHSQCLGSST